MMSAIKMMIQQKCYNFLSAQVYEIETVHDDRQTDNFIRRVHGTLSQMSFNNSICIWIILIIQQHTNAYKSVALKINDSRLPQMLTSSFVAFEQQSLKISTPDLMLNLMTFSKQKYETSVGMTNENNHLNDQVMTKVGKKETDVAVIDDLQLSQT